MFPFLNPSISESPLMFIIPFVWFSTLSFLLWRKHGGFDISVYISLLYTFTSFLAMLLVAFDMLGDGGILYFSSDKGLDLVPTLLFCITISLSILPFHLVYTRDIRNISCVSPFMFDAMSLFLILESMLNLYLVADSTLDILSGDLAAIRDSVYAGDATPAMLKAESLGFIFRVFYYFNMATLLCLPILFYNICFRHKPWWWNFLLFFASLSAPIAGIQSVDRTEMIYYALMMVFCILFFWPQMSRRLRRKFLLFLLPFIALGAVYVTVVSQARFEKQDGGAAVRNMQYTGQGYLNFCYFWNYANYDELTVERIFPYYSNSVLKKSSSLTRREERSGQQGFFISVFPTFVGDIMLDISPIGMVLWVTCFAFIGLLLIRQSHRTQYDISEVLLIFTMACIPVFGIFYYRYFSLVYTYYIVLALLYYGISRYRIRL